MTKKLLITVLALFASTSFAQSNIKVGDTVALEGLTSAYMVSYIEGKRVILRGISLWKLKNTMGISLDTTKLEPVSEQYVKHQYPKFDIEKARAELIKEASQ